MFSFIKNTFVDVLLMYRSFLNWNINKIFIYIWSFIFAFLVSLPFLLLMFLLAYFFWVDIKILFSNLLNNELTSNIYINFILFLITFIFFLANFYKYVLLNKVNFDLLNWKKSKVLKNYYFDFKLIKKYFLISIINISLFIILFLIFLILFIILFFAFWWFEWIQIIISNWNNNIFSILSLVLFVIFVISFIYLLYRVIFSYYIFIDEEYKIKKSIDCIKNSFKLTKWFKNVFKFFTLIIIFTIFLIPSYIAISFFNNNIVNINNYFTYKYWIDEEQKNQINQTYIQSLELEFSNYSIEQLSELLTLNSRYILWINLINFILFFWMFSMVWTSFYKRELLKNK